MRSGSCLALQELLELIRALCASRNRRRMFLKVTVTPGRSARVFMLPWHVHVGGCWANAEKDGSCAKSHLPAAFPIPALLGQRGCYHVMYFNIYIFLKNFFSWIFTLPPCGLGHEELLRGQGSPSLQSRFQQLRCCRQTRPKFSIQTSN